MLHTKHQSLILQILKRTALLQENKLAEVEHVLANNKNTSVVPLLINRYSVNSLALAKACAEFFKIPFIDLHEMDKTLIPKGHVNYFLIKNEMILPIKLTSTTLVVALSNPDDLKRLDEWHFQTGLNITPVFADYEALKQLCNELKSQTQYSQQESASAADLLQQLLIDAIHRKASDLHFEPFTDHCRIRMRIDGLLQIVTQTALSASHSIVSRIKVLAELDIAEKRLPQEGHFNFKAPDGSQRDCRVSTCPTVFGEKIVIRILDANVKLLQLEDLGFDPEKLQQFLKALHKPQGLILVTGPTGSGKTVTLYSALNYLNHIHKNILTIEDPVEIQLPGINQVNVNYKIGFDFAKALKTFLRQDPDIIMLGEIRDRETAEIAIRASQTGHLVLATLHTNSAAETLTRLINMKIAPFNIASSILLIMAQRLLRQVCAHCQAKGEHCVHCTNGYKGRKAIFELMSISSNLIDLILQKGSSRVIAEQATQEGMQTLWQAGLQQVAAKLTTMSELQRVVAYEDP